MAVSLLGVSKESLATKTASLLRISTAGSVDDGKSTLIGRMFHDAKSLMEDQLVAMKSEGARRGRTSNHIDFAALTDGLRSEREQGITIDVAYRYFSTPNRTFILADTPGHEQYTRNMATGASTADCAIILIDASKGITTQTKRHAFLSLLLGIEHIAVAINKMDLVDYSPTVFKRIQKHFLSSVDGIERAKCAFFPISALEGDNVVDRSPHTHWYSGPTLLHYLENLELSKPEDSAFRLPVQYVLRPDQKFRGFAGQIAAGSVQPGDSVCVLPSGRKSRIKELVTFDGPLSGASKGKSVTLTLEDEVDVSRGDMIVAEKGRPTPTRRFRASIVWLSESPMTLDKSYLIKHTTRTTKCWVENVNHRVDVRTFTKSQATSLELNDIGVIEIESAQPLLVDEYAKSRNTGNFILIDPVTNNTVGAGMVVATSLSRNSGRKVRGSESWVRSVAKALTWRTTATITTAVSVYFFTGNMRVAFAVGGVEIVAKLGLYFIHERIWNRVPLGKGELLQKGEGI